MHSNFRMFFLLYIYFLCVLAIMEPYDDYVKPNGLEFKVE